MKTSVIRHRVADFLKSHAPFDALGPEELLALAGSGRVKFHESEESVYDEGDEVGAWVWVIQQGRVEMLAGGQLQDLLGAGDLLGLDRFAGASQYRQSARTATDVILYAVDAAIFEEMVARHAPVKHYLAAHFSPGETAGFGRTSWLDAPAPPAAFLRARFGEASAVTTRSAVREMLESGTEQLASGLTADDLALFCHRNPARLLREIRTAGSTPEMAALVELATQMVLDGMAHAADVDDCSRLGAAIVAAVAHASIRLAQEGLAGFDAPTQAACWLTFGATARCDLARPVWPGIAAVYNDTGDAAEAYFAALNGETASCLHGLGWEGAPPTWPAGAHPCMPLSAWKGFFTDTIARPLEYELYQRREFFDLRPLYGPQATLNELREHIRGQLREHPALVPLMANDTLCHLPPLTFFGGMVVGLDGGERPSFDVAQSALTPIADAARVFALAKGRIELTNTLDRLTAAAQDFPARAGIFSEAAEAFRIALFHQTLSGQSLIAPGELGRYDSRLLKTAFGSIGRLLEGTAEEFLP